MREQTDTTDVTTDPPTLVGGTFTHTNNSITFTCNKASTLNTQMGLEILNDSGVVIKRKVTALAGAMPNGGEESATISGLAPQTVFHCRGFRGDEGLADL